MTTLNLKKSGDLTGSAGTAFYGNTIQPDRSLGGSNKPFPGTVSAEVEVTAATASLAVYLKWQVSRDQSTWIDVNQTPNNAAPVALVTGAAAKITRVAEAPPAIYGYPYARAALYSGGATGEASDVVSIGYTWQKPIAT